jgi:hypothetical protein
MCNRDRPATKIHFDFLSPEKAHRQGKYWGVTPSPANNLQPDLQQAVSRQERDWAVSAKNYRSQQRRASSR